MEIVINYKNNNTYFVKFPFSNYCHSLNTYSTSIFIHFFKIIYNYINQCILLLTFISAYYVPVSVALIHECLRKCWLFYDNRVPQLMPNRNFGFCYCTQYISGRYVLFDVNGNCPYTVTWGCFCVWYIIISCTVVLQQSYNLVITWIMISHQKL